MHRWRGSARDNAAKQHPITWVQPRLADLAAQDRDLMTQHQ
jgi:hypothetical protein